MIKTVILDDEIHSTETLGYFLSKKCPKFQLLASFNDPLAAFDYLQNNEIELLILDIEMPRINGFELLKKLQPFKFEVIFLTAYNEFALKAFRYCAFDYFLKPLDEIELTSSLNRLAERINSTDKDIRLAHLLEFLKPNNNPNQKKIALPTISGYEFLELDQIIRIESDSNYVNIYSINNSPILICKTLKEMEETLGESHFIRVHNSHIVNTLQVIRYIKNGGGALLTSDNYEVPMSRLRKEYALSKLNIK